MLVIVCQNDRKAAPKLDGQSVPMPDLRGQNVAIWMIDTYLGMLDEGNLGSQMGWRAFNAHNRDVDSNAGEGSDTEQSHIV